jgi:hypothetical protein
VTDAPPGPELNAAQQQLLDRLSRPASERPTFDADLAGRLRTEMEARLAEVAENIGRAGQLFVDKRKLAGVFGCEVWFLHDEGQPFYWDPPRARGTVAHKAIELGVNWRPRPAPDQLPGADGESAPSPGPAPPAELVDAALESLTAGDTALADWLYRCGDAARAELRSLAVSRVTDFWEGWPPLSPKWFPTTESRCRVELCDGRIQLSGKFDLTLGRAKGQQAGKVIVDLKTGRRHRGTHRDDLRFYALLETLKLGTPPRTLATYYLESAEIDAEDVTEELLEVALNRTVDGIGRYAELHGHLGAPAEPLKRPGPPCRWCELLDGCGEGQAFVADGEDR